jgi:hypothetical protein
MVNSMISGVAGESARGATGGFQSDLATRARANAASVGQAAYGKAMASQGFALQSLGYSIAGAEQSMAQAELGAMNGSLSRQGASMSAEQRVKAANVVAAAAQMGAAIAGNPRGGGGSGGGGGDGDGGGAPFKAGIALGQAFQAYAAGSDNLEASRQIGMQSQANDIAGFKAGQTANQLGIAGRNMDRMADFSAQGAAWQTKNAFANQVNGMLSASGLMSGAIDAGPKPTDQMGMAMSGMLGGAAKSAAWHMDYNKGGFGQSIGKVADGLTSNYGAEKVRSSYQNQKLGSDDLTVIGAAGAAAAKLPSVAAGPAAVLIVAGNVQPASTTISSAPRESPSAPTPK